MLNKVDQSLHSEQVRYMERAFCCELSTLVQENCLFLNYDDWKINSIFLLPQTPDCWFFQL